MSRLRSALRSLGASGTGEGAAAAAAPCPPESDIGELAGRVAAGEAVTVCVPKPDMPLVQVSYEISGIEFPPYVLIRADGEPVNDDEWSLTIGGPLPRCACSDCIPEPARRAKQEQENLEMLAGFKEQGARAALAAIFAGRDLSEFTCGHMISSATTTP